MKLKVNQIQFLDFLLKRMQSDSSNFLNADEKLSLVIDVNGNLWTGDFVNYSNFHIQNISLDYDGDLTSTEIDLISIITVANLDDFKRFNFKDKFHNINSSNLYILLNELLKKLDKVNCSNLVIDPIIFNAVNLNSSCKLPFIYIDNTIEYDVVSLIVSNKN